MRPKKKIEIVGGGFSGLMAGLYLSRSSDFEIHIREGQRWGGLLQTCETEWGLVEEAANGFLLTSLIFEAAQEIGVQLQNSKPDSRIRYLCRQRPERVTPLSKAVSLALLRLGWKRLLGQHRPRPSETLSDWGDRVLGAQVSHDILVPAVQGIYVTDARKLSARLVLNPLFQKGRRPRKGLVSPLRGMGEWTEALLKTLKDRGVILKEEKVSRLPDADQVILAGSAGQKSQLLRSSSSVNSRFFDQTQTLALISVHTFWKKTSQDLSGFGVLFHPEQGWKASGVLFQDQIFSNRSPHRCERWFLPQPSLLASSDESILKVIHEQRQRLEWKNELLGFHITRWPKALPWYSVEHEVALETWEALEKPKGLHFLGNELGEIGLTSLAEKAWQLGQRIQNG